jgi:hypothetical protein
MQEHLVWFIAGAVSLAFVQRLQRLVRYRHRDGINVAAQGRRYEWAKDGEI